MDPIIDNETLFVNEYDAAFLYLTAGGIFTML